MKIIYTVHQFFPDWYTGTEQYVYNLCRGMQNLGHSTSVTAYSPYKDSELKDSGILLSKNYTYKGVSASAVKQKRESDYIMFDVEQADVNAFYKELLKREKPDILHIAHGLRQTSAFDAARELGIKVVLTLTDYWYLCAKAVLIRNDNSLCPNAKDGQNCQKFCLPHLTLDTLRKRIARTRQMFEYADAVIVDSNFIVDIFAINGYKTSRAKVIHHGFSYTDETAVARQVKSDAGTFTILFLGGFQKQKGPHLLIEAFKKIPDPNLRLKIYGVSFGDEYGNTLPALGKGDPRISFPGKYRPEEIGQIIRQGDVVAIPSVWYENYPFVGVNSLAYGVPIIVPDFGGVREMVRDGENGFLFSIGNAESLKNAINKAIKAKLKYTKNILYPYTLEDEIVQTENIYSDLLKG